MTDRSILVVDDEHYTRQGLKRMLEKQWSSGIQVFTAADGHEALQILSTRTIDLLITDIRMPEISGLHLIDELNKQSRSRSPAFILISGYAEFEYAQEAIKQGVVNYLLKPIKLEALIEAVEQALDRYDRNNRVNRLLRIADPKLIDAGEEAVFSDPVREAIQYIDQHMHQSCGLKEIAEHVHLNPSYFSALFKEQMRMTLSEYATRRKLQKAKDLLLYTNQPIAEIAEQIGYQSTRYFNRIFKEYEGISPGGYRSKIKNDDSLSSLPKKS